MNEEWPVGAMSADSGAQGLSLAVCNVALGWQGRWTVAQSMRVPATWDMNLYSKLVLKGKLFSISRNWLALGGAVPPPSTRLQMSKHQNRENRRHDYYSVWPPALPENGWCPRVTFKRLRRGSWLVPPSLLLSGAP